MDTRFNSPFCTGAPRVEQWLASYTSKPTLESSCLIGWPIQIRREQNTNYNRILGIQYTSFCVRKNICKCPPKILSLVLTSVSPKIFAICQKDCGSTWIQNEG